MHKELVGKRNKIKVGDWVLTNHGIIIKIQRITGGSAPCYKAQTLSFTESYLTKLSLEAQQILNKEE